MTDWRRLLENHGPLVWKTLKRLIDDPSDAADCFQDTFLAAWRRHLQEPIRSWEALLIHLATIQALDCLRQKIKQRLFRHNNDAEQFVDTKAIRPDDALLQQEWARDFRKALGEIDNRQATVFCMVYFEELSYEVIADACSISVSNVGVLYHRAKTALQEQLVQL